MVISYHDVFLWIYMYTIHYTLNNVHFTLCKHVNAWQLRLLGLLHVSWHPIIIIIIIINSLILQQYN